jgi:hypothetical protein
MIRMVMRMIRVVAIRSAVLEGAFIFSFLFILGFITTIVPPMDLYFGLLYHAIGSTKHHYLGF